VDWDKNKSDYQGFLSDKNSDQTLENFSKCTSRCKSDSDLMHEIDVLIESKLSSNSLTTVFLQKNLGINRNRLQLIVKAYRGCTPVAYIRIQKLLKARALLQNTSCNVSEAGYAVGFNQVSYFSRCYKSLFGISPINDCR